MSLSVSLRVSNRFVHLRSLSLYEAGRATVDPEAGIGYRVHLGQTSPPFEHARWEPIGGKNHRPPGFSNLKRCTRLFALSRTRITISMSVRAILRKIWETPVKWETLHKKQSSKCDLDEDQNSRARGAIRCNAVQCNAGDEIMIEVGSDAGKDRLKSQIVALRVRCCPKQSFVWRLASHVVSGDG
jgi:hypothetical protein